MYISVLIQGVYISQCEQVYISSAQVPLSRRTVHTQVLSERSRGQQSLYSSAASSKVAMAFSDTGLTTAFMDCRLWTPTLTQLWSVRMVCAGWCLPAASSVTAHPLCNPAPSPCPVAAHQAGNQGKPLSSARNQRGALMLSLQTVMTMKMVRQYICCLHGWIRAAWRLFVHCQSPVCCSPRVPLKTAGGHAAWGPKCLSDGVMHCMLHHALRWLAEACKLLLLLLLTLMPGELHLSCWHLCAASSIDPTCCIDISVAVVLQGLTLRLAV